MEHAIADVGSDVSKSLGKVYDDVSTNSVEVLESGNPPVNDAYDNVTETCKQNRADFKTYSIY